MSLFLNVYAYFRNELSNKNSRDILLIKTTKC